MLVTLNTDGSLDYPEQGVLVKGGWAYWISSDVGRFKLWGKCPPSDNSMGPELAAIAKGVARIRNCPKLNITTKIIVNTDCVPAINWVKSINKRRSNYKKHKGSLQNIARHHILRMVKEGYNGLHEVKLEFRHVKAHTDDLSTPRSWVNNWLDEHANKGRLL